MSDFIKCKYAGDPEDEGCCTCNGLNFTSKNSNGEWVEYPCTQCDGYEPGEVDIEVEDTDCVPWEEPEKTLEEPVEEICSDSPCEEPVSEPNECAAEVENTAHTANAAEITKITAGTGISVELNGVWYKFDYSEERMVNPYKPIEEQRTSLWTDVFNQVDNALADTKESLGLK